MTHHYSARVNYIKMMKNFENEKANLRAEIATLRRENATLNANVDRLTTLVGTLRAGHAYNHPLPPPPSSALLRKRGYPQGEENFPRPAMSVASVINVAPTQQRPDNGRPGRVTSFDPIPITYTELYPILIQKNWVQTRRPLVVPKRVPRGHNPEASCIFHQGAPGHNLENCFSLKVEVQKLMRAGILTFKGTAVNVDTNHISSPQISSGNRKDGCSRAAQQPQQSRVMSFDPIPMTYTELYPTLIAENLVQLRQPPVVPKKLPWWYKTNASCAFHQNALGHSLEDCFPLKVEVQKLMRAGILTFKDAGPIVKTNPMADYAGASTSMMDTDQ